MIAWMATLALALQTPMTPQERFDRAALVVVGEVTGHEVVWAPGVLGGLETHVWVAPERALRGDLPSTLEITLLGGVRGAVRVEVDDAPTLVDDRRYLLFLAPDAHHRWTVLGGVEGAIRLDTPGQSPGPSLSDVLTRLGLSTRLP